MISEDTNILIVRVPYHLPYFRSSRMAYADWPLSLCWQTLRPGRSTREPVRQKDGPAPRQKAILPEGYGRRDTRQRVPDWSGQLPAG